MSEKKMDRLDKAIAAFDDETLDLTMGERISLLRSALGWAAFERLKRVHELGTKAEESEELEYKQIECQKQFKIIVQNYESEIKQNKILGKPQESGMDKEFLKRIKDMKSSVGNIVVNTQNENSGQ